jgi:hypothetical protein
MMDAAPMLDTAPATEPPAIVRTAGRRGGDRNRAGTPSRILPPGSTTPRPRRIPPGYVALGLVLILADGTQCAVIEDSAGRLWCLDGRPLRPVR